MMFPDNKLFAQVTKCQEFFLLLVPGAGWLGGHGMSEGQGPQNWTLPSSPPLSKGDVGDSVFLCPLKTGSDPDAVTGGQHRCALPAGGVHTVAATKRGHAPAEASTLCCPAPGRFFLPPSAPPSLLIPSCRLLNSLSDPHPPPPPRSLEPDRDSHALLSQSYSRCRLPFYTSRLGPALLLFPGSLCASLPALPLQEVPGEPHRVSHRCG